MKLRDLFFSPARDRELAATKYADRESATAKAARKRRERHHQGVALAAAKAEQWEERDRRRFN